MYVGRFLTKLCEHSHDGHFICPVDDVIDVGRCGQAERVNPNPAFALRRRVQQRGLETNLA